MATSVCLLQTEIGNSKEFLFVAANERGKQKFVFLGQQRINSNQRLLFQQTCSSIHITTITSPTIY
jgi:hypothetical protein